MKPLAKGMRVQFLRDNLGASEWDSLSRAVAETFGIGEKGTVSFPHPNQKGCPGWWYVEVESKREPGRKFYVGVHPSMVVELPAEATKGGTHDPTRCTICALGFGRHE